jgi:hypothetical protein
MFFNPLAELTAPFNRAVEGVFEVAAPAMATSAMLSLANEDSRKNKKHAPALKPPSLLARMF